jgi:cell division septum initiation protein DivIVA
LTQKLQEVASRPVPAAPQAAPAAAAVAVASEVPLPSSREDADMLQRTLLLAQRAADDAVNEAQTRARQLLEESEAKAQSLVSDAEATARRIAEGERRRLEAEILDSGAPRAVAPTPARAYAAGYRRIRAAIEADSNPAVRSKPALAPRSTTSTCLRRRPVRADTCGPSWIPRPRKRCTRAV